MLGSEKKIKESQESMNSSEVSMDWKGSDYGILSENNNNNNHNQKNYNNFIF